MQNGYYWLYSNDGDPPEIIEIDNGRVSLFGSLVDGMVDENGVVIDDGERYRGTCRLFGPILPPKVEMFERRENLNHMLCGFLSFADAAHLIRDAIDCDEMLSLEMSK